MLVRYSAALCAAFLVSLSAIAMDSSSLSLYGGALQFECTEDAQRVKLTAKTGKQFAAKIVASSASGNKMSYGFSNRSSLNLGFGVNDLPIRFEVISESEGSESFTLEAGCQLTSNMSS